MKNGFFSSRENMCTSQLDDAYRICTSDCECESIVEGGEGARGAAGHNKRNCPPPSFPVIAPWSRGKRAAPLKLNKRVCVRPYRCVCVSECVYKPPTDMSNPIGDKVNSMPDLISFDKTNAALQIPSIVHAGIVLINWHRRNWCAGCII